MQAFLVSTGVVALAEIGDKTQLLAFVLAARYRRAGPVLLGILAATIVCHALAGAVGATVIRFLGPDVLRWVLALSFFAMAAWILVPDRLDASAAPAAPRYGVFGTTVATFVVAEMGDKTQLVTAALAARYASFYAVVAGATLGMMLANIPAVLIGERLAGWTPTRLTHAIAALVFTALGILVLLGRGGGLPG